MNEQKPSTPSPAGAKRSGLAISSLILGGLSIFPLGVFGAIPAIVCGHLGVVRIKRSSGVLSGRGLAIAGLVLGYLGLALIPVKFVAINNAREKAREVSCQMNLHQVYQQCQMMAMDSANHEYPTNIDQVRAGAVTVVEPNPKFLVCHAAKDKTRLSYEIVARGDWDALPRNSIVIKEIEPNHKGRRGVVHADGTVEMVQP
jgi:hypothetical protein